MVGNKNQNKTLTVNVHRFRPFVMNQGGRLSGFDIDLWNEIARDIRLDSTFLEVPFSDIFDNLRSGQAGAALAGISITSERFKKIGFSQPYFESGLSILVSRQQKVRGLSVAKFFLQQKAFRWLGYFVLIVLIAGHAVWLLESGAAVSALYYPGILEAFWFSIVTITTVGYGDVVPVSGIGKAFAVLLMLIGISIFTSLAANLASGITVFKLRSDIRTSADLRGRVVATKSGSSSVSALTDLGAEVVTVPDINLAYEKLERGEVDAVVFDLPNLLDYVKRKGEGKVMIVGKPFQHQHYGIALQVDSLLRRDINLALLKLEQTGKLDELQLKWFGTKLDL